MGISYSEGNDSCANWHPPNSGDPDDQRIPPDLQRYMREVHTNRWVYVCPHCKNHFEPGWGGMPETFRKHLAYKVRDDDPKEVAGVGCFFKPPRSQNGSTKGLEGFKV